MSLWATYFYSAKLENSREILDEWSPFFYDSALFSNGDWTMAQAKTTIRSDKNDSLPWGSFFNSIEPHLNSFLESLDPQMSYKIVCDEHWLNVYNKSDYQEPHDHAFPGRGISLIYLLEYPDDNDAGGQLIFECPNFQMIRGSGLDRIFNAYNYQHITPQMERGTLILFPSWISHYVLPSKSENLRASIAANFIITPVQDNE